MFSAAHPLGAAALLSVAAAVPAQPAPSAPATPAEPVLPWRSTFEGYQPFADQQVGDWRAANETVGRIGGWRAYAWEAQQQDGGAKPAGSPAPAAPAPAHEHGHGKP